MIAVTLKVVESMVVLTVEDNGVGFSKDFDASQVESTGLLLVEQLSQLDLSGSVAYENREQGGARVKVMFPRPIVPEV